MEMADQKNVNGAQIEIIVERERRKTFVACVLASIQL